MRIFAFLLALCIAWPARAEPFGSSQTLDQRLVAAVTSTALAFMLPRTLEPIPFWQLSLWGLRGLTTLDSRLTVDINDGVIRMRLDARTVITHASPGPQDAVRWGETIAQFMRVGWDASETVRRSGTQGVLEAFFAELFSHLDPYSRYSPPGEAAESRVRRAGRAGIGVQVARRGAGFVVQDVAADGPAALAGVRAGDRLIRVDGQPTANADLRAVTMLLGGPEGSPVAVTVRGRDGKARSLTIVRALVPPETVTASRNGELLVLRVEGFSSDTTARLAHEIVAGLATSPAPRAVVLDLRGNRGGLLRQAAAAAGTLIANGPVAMTVGRNRAADHEFTVNGNDLAHGLPVVVLVDGRTASAAEILAAALADRGRAVVVGSSTLGKGLVQTITGLPDGGELLVSWSRVLAPLGWPIQGLGVLPQLCTSLGAERLNQQLAALRKGDSLMASALARHQAARWPVPAVEMLRLRDACPAAEGRDGDIAAVRALLRTPPAYVAALLPPAP